MMDQQRPAPRRRGGGVDVGLWMSRVVSIGVVVLGLAACGDEAAPPSIAGTVDTGPGTADVGIDVPIVPQDTNQNEVKDTSKDVQIIEGGPGWPCDVNGDCDSDWCVPSANGKVCSELCVENCTLETEGWGCKPVANLSDPVNICVPLFDKLCNPCNEDADCGAFGDVDAFCLKREDGQGSFCGGDCSTKVACPSGYTCETITLQGIGDVKQCVPESGECTCSAAAVSAALSTNCSQVNEIGTCTGARTCLPEGLSACSAEAPTVETCDGKDNDCDGLTDEEDAEGCESYYKDVDGDLYGTDDPPRCLCAPDNNYRAVQTGDCDDKLVNINPGAPELCDDIDNNCNAATDEEDALGCKDYWADEDNDTWGDENKKKCLCAPDDIYKVQKPGDCNDEKDTVFPGAPETCSGEDQNCDGAVGPENTPGCINYYLDSDEDEYGVSSNFRCLCAPSAPHTALVPGDCNDGSDEIKPGAPEACDNVDNDCDGSTDPADSVGCTNWLKDGDKDDFGDDADVACLCEAEAPYDTVVGGDCDDETDLVSPDAEEKCNTIDDDCNGATDEAGAAGCKTYYKDTDNDGYGLETDSQCLCSPTDPYDVEIIGDCNDELDTIGPEANEVCGNDVDENCNGSIDDEGAEGCTTYYLDVDDDTWGVAGTGKCLCGPTGDFTATKIGDCNDAEASANPDAVETCADDIDNDCNEGVNEEGALGCTTYYFDGDKDQFGLDDSGKCLCAPTGSYTALLAGDCKDTNDKIKPGQAEVCNQEDDDCNDVIDDEGALGCEIRFLDEDGDTFGVPGSGKCLCSAQGDYDAPQAGDCDDDDLLIYPGQPCSEPACAGFTVTNPFVCSGQGVCDQGGGTAPCPGGYVCENASTCKTACTGDGDCIPGNFCVAGVCSGKKLDGSPCTAASECQSDHCQNGFCCASGDCCGGANSHCNDQNVCTNDVCGASFQCETTNNTAQCQAAFCDGDVFTSARTCSGGTCADGGAETVCSSPDACLVASCTLSGCTLKNAAAGLSCTTPSCLNGQITAAKLCDGAGGCSVGGSTSPCPGGFSCETGTACRVECTNDTHCRSNFYCATSPDEAGLCLPKKSPGTTCQDDSECGSGYCNNGYCCSSGTCCSTAADCNDDNICTTDSCLPTFQCANPENTVQCEGGSCNGSTYTEPKFCSGGACTVGGSAVQCDTGNPCLFDLCGPSGCGTSPVPIGTTCAPSTCTNFTLTNQKVCDGSGACELGGTVASCPGGYTCNATADGCRTTCAADNHCQPGMYCDGGNCFSKKSSGGTCSDDSQCVSGYCNNGFCCADGKCCNTTTDCNDGNPCTTDACSTQKKCVYTFNTVQCEDGSCNGTTWTAPKTCQSGQCVVGGAQTNCNLGNPCRNYGCMPTGCTQTLALNGTVCAESSCTGSSFTPAHTCTNGQCINPGASPCPGGNVCGSAAGCGSGCNSSEDCQNGWYCGASGNCQPQRDDGDACTTDAQCASEHCNNGFCCATGKCCSKAADCDDSNVCTTETCSASFICSSQSNNAQCEAGSCSGLSYTTPKSCSGGACVVGGTTQDCSGTNVCKAYSCGPNGCESENLPSGLQCEAPSCTVFVLTAPTTCNGLGQCNQGGTSSPCAGGYGCLDGSTCRTSCTQDGHCAPSYYCGSGVCQPKRVNGDACQAASQCASGYCANGYCCNGPTGDCCAQAFHCDDANPCTTDSCGAQFGCVHTNNTNQCATASCDGLVHTAETYCSSGTCSDGGTSSSCSGTNPCKTYGCSTSGCTVTDVPTGIQCAPQACSGFNLTQALTCNGAGSCSGGGTVAACAGGLTCLNSTTCRSNCSENSHCQPGYFCSGGLCQAKRDDGEACTTASQCDSNYCANGFCCQDDGTGVTCCGGSASQCDDGNICTDDSCGTGYVCQNTDNTGKICQEASCNLKTFTFAKTCYQGACAAGGSQSTCPADTACRRFPCVEPNQPGDPQGCVVVDEPTGTPCGAGTCSDYTLTAASACDGSGNCVAGGSSGPCPGGFVCADGSSCRTTCVTDDDCQPGLVCQDGIACVAKKANGQQCTQGTECLSDYCNSGFCCDSGVCCQVSGDCNDGELCTNDVCSNNQCSNPANTATCDAGSCDGLTWTAPKVCDSGSCPISSSEQDCSGPNTCKIYSCSASLGCQSMDAPTGTQCAPSSCVGSTLTQARTCNGAGSCLTASSAPCPGKLRCADASTCLSTCTTNADCVAGNYCADGSCLEKKLRGATCTSSSQCQSDYCNSGICCDGGQCCAATPDCNDGNSCTTNTCVNNQCTIAFDTNEVCQSSSCSNLTFTAELRCNDSGACNVGGATSDCSGSNICLVYGCGGSGCTTVPATAGTQCAPASCSDGVLTQPTTCDGSGSCSSGGSTGLCSGGLQCLNATTCRSTCTNDSHCRSDFYCSGGSCVEKKAAGVTCSASNQCQSAYCANGYCCDSGLCCASSNDCGDGNQCTTDLCQDNQCAWVNNNDTCGVGECAGLIHTSASTCSGGTCSGGGASQDCSGSDACKTYGCQESGCIVGNQPSGTQCAPASCVGSTLTTAETCNGQGLCNQGGVSGACPGNFVCKSSTVCHNQCTDDNQCVSGYYCSGGACLLKRADGQSCTTAAQCQSSYCNSGICCAGGQCCTSSTNCADGNVCTTDTCTSNMCSWTNNSAQCAASSCSGLTWTAAKFCSAGSCTGGGATTDCSGSNPCLDYGCGNLAGCTNTFKQSGTECDAASCDGTIFTPKSVCNGSGTCVASADQECDDGDICTGSETCDVDDGCVAGNPSSVYVCNDGTCNATCEDASSCSSDCSCSPGYALALGEVDSWATNGGGSTNRISSYACSASSYPGNEYTYSFVAPRTGTLEISLVGGDSQTDVLVLSGTGGTCDPAECIAQVVGGGSTASFSTVAGTTYYFVVDRRALGAVSFELKTRYTDTCATPFSEGWERTNFPRAWTSTDNWQQAQDTPFGQWHAKFTGSPTLTTFERALTSPVFSTSTCTGTVRVNFEWRFTEVSPANASTAVDIVAEVSTNGTTWTEIFAYDTINGSSATIETESIVTSAIAGSSTARIRFVVKGDTSAHVNRFQVEDISVTAP